MLIIRREGDVIKFVRKIDVIVICGLLTLLFLKSVSAKAQPISSTELIENFHLYNLAFPILAIRDCYLYDLPESELRPAMISAYSTLIGRYGSEEAIRQATFSLIDETKLSDYGSFDAACGAYQDWLRMVDTDTRAYLAGWLKIFETIEPVSN